MNVPFSFKIAFAALTAAVVISSCNNSPYPDYEMSESGIYSKFYNHDEAAVKPNEGDVIHVIMSYKNDKDSMMWESKNYSREGNAEIFFPLTKPRHKGSFEEAMQTVGVGDSVSFKVNADSTFGDQLPKGIEKGSMVTFEVRLKKITTKDEVEKERAKRMEEQQVMLEMRKSEEPKALEKYLADNKITAKPTASGLYYIELKRGSGPKPKQGEMAAVNYTGMLLDGTIFDTSDEATAKKGGVFNPQRPYEPYDVAVGMGQVIPGWDEALAMMPVGTKARIIVPSSLAYAEQGGGPIPPYSTLVFEMEVTKISPAPQQPQQMMPGAKK
jgi:FKBP-type peptidyl-prolyl cis-trans isomerase FkpA